MSVTVFFILHLVDPSSWHTLTGYSTCSGTEQSPIDVTTSIADDDTSIPLFDFSDLADTTNVQLKMINDGHRGMIIRYFGLRRG